MRHPTPDRVTGNTTHVNYGPLSSSSYRCPKMSDMSLVCVPSTSKQDGGEDEAKPDDIVHSSDADPECLPSTSKDDGDAQSLQDAQQEENELQALGINAYDQTELESEFIAQVNERMKAEEDESRRKLSRVELKNVSAEIK